MTIIVYFETLNNSSSEIVAQFSDDALYNACLPVLEKIAQESGYIVTESEREDEVLTDLEEI